MLRSQHGVKIKDVNFSILTTATLNNSAKAVIMHVIGKELRLESAIAIHLQVHAKLSNTTRTRFV